MIPPVSSNTAEEHSSTARLNRRKRGRQILLAMLAVVAVMRVSMAVNPTANYDVAGYNIHHLFTGILFLVAGAVPLALGYGHGRAGIVLNIVFGVGLGLVMDEWVYLIATDGTDLAYLTPASFWGSVIMVGVTAIAVLALSERQ